MRQILKRLYSQDYCIDHKQILQSDRDRQVLYVGGPNMPQTNPGWRTKQRKIAISSQLRTNFEKNWHGDVPQSSDVMEGNVGFL